MLANLLPGLRHTRTPLVAGGLWILVAWLVLGELLLPSAEGGRVELLLHDLAEMLGNTAVLAAVALLATLIGGMAPRLPVKLIARRLPINRAGRRWQSAVSWFFGIEPDLAVARGEFNHWLFRRVSLVPEELEWSQFAGKYCPPVLQVAARDLQESGSALVGRQRLDRADFAGDPAPRDWLMWGLAEASIQTEVDSELPLQLSIARDSLFNEYDRIRAESELRAAIVLPLVILVGILMTEAWAWGLALLIPIWLVRQAVQSHVSADQQLLTAVRHGVIRSSTADFVDSLSRA